MPPLFQRCGIIHGTKTAGVIMSQQNPLRYIVMLLNTDIRQYTSDGQKVDTHDGYIFSSIADAREYCYECIEENYCDKFVIGVTTFDPNTRTNTISLIETHGFKNDRKNIEQLQLFN